MIHTLVTGSTANSRFFAFVGVLAITVRQSANLAMAENVHLMSISPRLL